MIRNMILQFAPDIFTVVGIIYVVTVSYWGLKKLKS